MEEPRPALCIFAIVLLQPDNHIKVIELDSDMFDLVQRGSVQKISHQQPAYIADYSELVGIVGYGGSIPWSVVFSSTTM